MKARALGAILAFGDDLVELAGSLIGSVAVGRRVAESAASRLKHVSLELGGKNAMVIYPDADIAKAAAGAVRGMNFGWCGQSCTSTSRVFVHADIYDRVVEGIVEGTRQFRPGIPTDETTTMGALISGKHRQMVLGHIGRGRDEGAELLAGGNCPNDPILASGYYLEPTVFGNVSMRMGIAREEIFGPVLSIFRWSDEADMLSEVNALDYGLTASVFTRDIDTAIRAGRAIEAGVVSINAPSGLPFGTPFGGYKMSGIGRDSAIEELFSYTQIKNLSIYS